MAGPSSSGWSPIVSSASTSSSSSSSSLPLWPSSEANFLSSPAPFLTGPHYQQLNDAVRKCANVVCRVHTPDPKKRGTGCLIQGALLLTNHHVLKDIETARKSVACFFQVTSQSAGGMQTQCEIVKISLDPDRFFFTSPDSKIGFQVLPAREGFLDFTLVALDVDSNPGYLSRIQHAAFTLFQDIPLEIEKPVCVIQYPEVLDPDTMIQGDVKRSFGYIKRIDVHSLYHNAPTEEGSSGGAIIDLDGRLIALHHQREGEFNVGVLAGKISLALQSYKQEIEKWANMTLPAPPAEASDPFSSSFPPKASKFTGREEELRQFHDLFQDEPFVAVVGLGGVGKTTFTIEYAYRYRSNYRTIHFIEARNEDWVEAGFLCLADALEIPSGNNSILRIKRLQEKLNTQDGQGVLVVIDGADDGMVLSYLTQQLPQRTKAKFIVLSRRSALPTRLKMFPLGAFNEGEARSYLIKAVEGRDDNHEEAGQLARLLKCFPLLLAQVGAFICHTNGYSFAKYRQDLEKEGAKSFQYPELNFSYEHEGIFASWNKSISMISTLPQGDLAVEMLRVLSTLAEGQIPIALIIAKFEDRSEREVRSALELLGNYCLLDVFSTICLIHPLVREVIYAVTNLENPSLIKQWRMEWLTVVSSLVQRQPLVESTPSAQVTTSAFAEFAEGNRFPIHKLMDESLVRHVDFMLKNIPDNVEPDLDVILKVGASCMWFYSNCGRARSVISLGKCLLILFKKFAPRSEGTVFMLSQLAKSCTMDCVFEKALAYALEALSIQEERFQGQGKELIKSHLVVGNVYVASCKYDQALSVCEKALSLLADLPKEIQENLWPLSAQIHHMMATVYFIKKNFPCSDKHMDLAIALVPRGCSSGIDQLRTLTIIPPDTPLHQLSIPNFNGVTSAIEITLSEIKEKLGDRSLSALEIEGTLALLYPMVGKAPCGIPHFRTMLESAQDLREECNFFTLFSSLAARTYAASGECQEAADVLLQMGPFSNSRSPL